MRLPKWSAVLLIGAFAGWCFANEFATKPNSVVALAEKPVIRDQDSLAHANGLSKAFRQAANIIRPAVVSIEAEQRIRMTGRRSQPQMPPEFRRFFGDDMDLFFQSPQMPREGVRRGSGSGVFVSTDGYILTNNHVVADADKVTVTTHDDQTFDAKVVGTDPKTDVAVLKVEGDGFSAAYMGDSDNLQVGDWVIAAGGPFGLDNTITAGIVSATKRNRVGITDYENFIQTDAAINPGNSGGPLVNLEGEIVGINTAIATRSGSNSGVGFTIPINMARDVMNSLVEYGRVDRGYLGAMIQDLSKDMARSFNFTGTHGVLIGDVIDDGPAAKAGLKSGDIVTEFNGRPMKNSSELRNLAAATRPNTRVELRVFRDGKTMMVPVTVGLLDDKVMISRTGDSSSSTDLGLTVRTLDGQLRENLGYDTNERGVVVTEVENGGLAASAGLRVKDVITSVNGKRVDSAASFREVMSDADIKQGIRLQLKRDGFTTFVFLKS